MIGCGVYDGQAGEFSTVELAKIVGVSRLNLYDWTCRKYVVPIRVSPRRGNAAVFDHKGLMAAAVFNLLRVNVRRPIAGMVSKWVQEHGHKAPGDVLHCVVRGKNVEMLNAYEFDAGRCNGSNYVIVLPIGSIRQWIKTRVKEIHANGQQSDRRGQAPQGI